MPYCRYRLAIFGGMCGWLFWLACTPGHTAERYMIVPQKSQLQFRAYSVLVNPLGKFTDFSGEIVADAQQLSASSVRLVIAAKSIDTDNAKRDKHLRSEDFLFVEKYPTLSFTSTAVSGQPPNYTVQGDLSLRGVTKRLTIPVTIEQREGEMRVQGSVTLSRKEFGITYNAIFNPVKDTVEIIFTMLGVRQ